MSTPLRVAFAGSPAFAATILRELVRSRHQVALVWTQPDRPAGRGRKLRQSAVKQTAEEYEIAVYEPTDLRCTQAGTVLANSKPDVLIVVAYGRLLPAPLLSVPRLGAINVHASLLPRWRGAAPIQHAILAGDQVTGISIMQMDEELDTGDILHQSACTIASDETAGSLHKRLALLGARSLMVCLAALSGGGVERTVQDATHATYAPRLRKQDALIDWTHSATTIERRIRAFDPWPIAHTTLDGTVLRLWKAQALNCRQPPVEPGTIIRASNQGIDVVSGGGVLRLLQVQLPGARPISALDFLNARPLAGTTRLGERIAADG